MLYSSYLGESLEPIRSKSDGWIKSKINHLNSEYLVSHATKVQQGKNGGLLVKLW